MIVGIGRGVVVDVVGRAVIAENTVDVREEMRKVDQVLEASIRNSGVEVMSVEAVVEVVVRRLLLRLRKAEMVGGARLIPLLLLLLPVGGMIRGCDLVRGVPDTLPAYSSLHCLAASPLKIEF